MHAYADLQTLKGTSVFNVTGTAHDAYLRTLLEVSSQEVDRYTARRFQPYLGTLYFDGMGTTLLNVPDLLSVTSLVEDQSNTGTFDTTWAANDYILWPYNANPTGDSGRPYQAVYVSDKSNGTQDQFLAGHRNYRIIGQFGFSYVASTLGLTVGSAQTATGTTLVLSGSATGTLEPGHTVLVGSEHMYVQSVTTGTSAVVMRAQNGSTAGTHSQGDAILLFSYPRPIHEATVMHAGRMFKRGQSAFASESGAPDGVVTVFRGGMDADVRMLVDPYRRITLGVF